MIKRILKIAMITIVVIAVTLACAYLILLPPDNAPVLRAVANSPLWRLPVSNSPLLLKGVTIVDTRNGELIKGRNILIQNGKIISISASNTVPQVKNLTIVDGSGKYVVPGYINMHMHVIDQGDPSAALASMLINGITGFRQMSGSGELLALRKKNGSLLLKEQPTLLAMPGSILTPVNTFGRDQAIKNVRDQKAEGADFIKIGLLPPDVFFAVLTEAKKQGIPALGHVPGNVDIIAASDSGFRSIEHLGLNYGGLTACSPESDRLRNGAPKTPPLLKFLPAFTDKLFMKQLRTTLVNPAVGTTKQEYARISRIIATFSETKARQVAAIYTANHTWQCPTLIKLRSYQLAFLPEVQQTYSYVSKEDDQIYMEVTRKYEKQLTPAVKQELLKAYQLQLKLVKIYDSSGVGLLAGTDGNSGFALHQEFDEFAKAGLSPLHILQTATINPAIFLNRTAEMGTVEAGKNADLVLLNSNPMESSRSLRDIDAVIHSGFYFKKMVLNKMIHLASSR